MESERMGHILGVIDKEKLDEQRGVVQNEKRLGENRPYGKARERLSQATYPKGHPYSWTVIGSMEDLNAASLDDVQEWFKSYYGPNNAVLVLAGDIDLETAKEKVNTSKNACSERFSTSFANALNGLVISSMRSSDNKLNDLKNYESVWRDPLRFNYKDLDIISMSLPSSGGILLGQMLCNAIESELNLAKFVETEKS